MNINSYSFWRTLLCYCKGDSLARVLIGLLEMYLRLYWERFICCVRIQYFSYQLKSFRGRLSQYQQGCTTVWPFDDASQQICALSLDLNTVIQIMTRRTFSYDWWCIWKEVSLNRIRTPEKIELHCSVFFFKLSFPWKGKSYVYSSLLTFYPNV